MPMTRWPCVFRHRFIREQVNPRLPSTTPFGAFQRAWRSEHCSQLDVYGTGACPYKPEECALAYYQTAKRAMAESTKSRVGLFRTLARKYGAERADNKPLAREILRTSGQPGAAQPDLDEGPRLRTDVPRSLGSLLGRKDG